MTNSQWSKIALAGLMYVAVEKLAEVTGIPDEEVPDPGRPVYTHPNDRREGESRQVWRARVRANRKGR